MGLAYASRMKRTRVAGRSGSSASVRLPAASNATTLLPAASSFVHHSTTCSGTITTSAPDVFASTLASGRFGNDTREKVQSGAPNGAQIAPSPSPARSAVVLPGKFESQITAGSSGNQYTILLAAFATFGSELMSTAAALAAAVFAPTSAVAFGAMAFAAVAFAASPADVAFDSVALEAGVLAAVPVLAPPHSSQPAHVFDHPHFTPQMRVLV